MTDVKYIVPGFKASAVASGLKKDGGTDLALFYSERDATAAGVFTTNRVKAAPVLLSRKNIRGGKARAIIANSGNANACTGDQGLRDARLAAALVAKELRIKDNQVLVASTGVIGLPLNMSAVGGAIPRLVKGLSAEGLPKAAESIMTTDTFPKIVQAQGEAGGKAYRIVGIAKGSGMIMPHMATMLCFLLTDIKIHHGDLRKALLESAQGTFNRITVDGDTSTNDTVLAMANGQAGNEDLSVGSYEEFRKNLRDVMGTLARMMVKDGEGATCVVKVNIKGARNSSDALKAARTVANSSLVKTAFFGRDPNWGRIMAAIGRAGIAMAENEVDIWVDDVQIVAGGMGKGAEAEKKAAGKMAQEAFSLTIDLRQGPYEDEMLTCDLTHDYVSINADYRS